MRKFLYVLLLISIFSLAGCGTGDSAQNAAGGDNNDEIMSVVTTIFPPYDFVRQIAGDKAELTMLLSPGTESHSYEPSPQDIIKIQEADIFIYVGGESDEWVKDILDSADTSSMDIIAMMDSVKVAYEEPVNSVETDDKDEEEPEYDEHIWTSPVNAIAIVQDITAALCRADSSNSSYYDKRASDYIDKLSSLDEQLHQVTDGAKRNTIIFGDRFPFRYLADQYGLDYYAAFPGCSTDTEASAATVAFLIDKLKEDNIPVVFYIELSNEQMTDAICEATGAKKLLLHSCHNVTKDDFEAGVTYVSLMEQNIRNLKEALN